ncbi:MAG TPA: GNAT family N-acetyltransferase [Anaeromyxobacter sp.]|nr:GNAT family N-acetyltransferase [Anaeromyxobacter sp.]
MPDDPFERSARQPRPASFRIVPFTPDHPDLHALLRGWDWIARGLLARCAVETLPRLEDSRRIVGELLGVLTGEEEGEGSAPGRLVRAALHRGQIQGVATIFLCRRAAFIELLASAPWNLLGPGDPPDARSVHGAGRALVEHASRLARRGGAFGRVTLQAENPRSLAAYRRMGFTRMQPSDAPLSLVPRGDKGWSAPVLRLARGRPGPEDRCSPWLVLDPERGTGPGLPASRPTATALAAVSAGR